MKKLLLCGLLFAFTLAASDVSGIWNGKSAQNTTKYGPVRTPVQVTLLQAGTNVTGTFKIDNAKPVAIKTGTASGNQVSISLLVGGGKVITANLTLQGTNQLTGNLTDSQGQMYALSLTKQ